MTTPPTNPQSQYERRLARQRQLEEMEAEASGAMPGMELDLGVGSSSGSGRSGSDPYTSMRQRNHDTARRFLHDDEEQEQIVFQKTNNSNISTASATARLSAGMDRNEAVTQSLFGHHRNSHRNSNNNTTSVNLMDHETGVYQEETTSVGIFARTMQSTKRLLFGRSSFSDGGTSHHSSHHHHDAVAADETDGFVGIASASGDPSRKQRATRCSSILVMLKTFCLSSRRRRLLAAGVLMALTLIILVVCVVVRAERLTPQEKKFQQNALRFHAIQEQVLAKGISHSDDFKNPKSAESRALRWIAYADPARLDPRNNKDNASSILLQRYALAVLFYNSFMAFEFSAGEQKAIERDDDEQYQGVPNPGWRRSDYWLSEKGICLWYGVECPPKRIGANLISNGVVKNQYDENGMVLALNMTGNQVYGPLSSSLKALEAMYSLDLSHNNLQGTFPSQLGYMFSVKTLYLHKNKLSGEIPPDIGFLEQVQDLNLGNNEFTGTLPSEINRLYNVFTLNVEHNQLQGQVPWVSKLNNLRNLVINDNSFNGTFPFTLSRLSNLNEIHLHKNKMSGTIHAEIETLRNLHVFQVHSNNFTGRFPNGIFESNKDLRQVSIQNNELRGSIPTFAGQLEQLTTLQMHNNRFTGSIPEDWNKMTSLEILHLQDNQIHGSLPASLEFMPALREFWANDNDITGEIPPQIASCTKLQQLFLYRNQLSGPIPDALSKMESLHTLRLEENQLAGAVSNETCLLKKEHMLSFLSVDCKNDVVQCACCDKCY